MTLSDNLRNLWQYISQGNVKYEILGVLILIVYIILFFTFINKSSVFNTYSVITNTIFMISIVLYVLYILIRFNGTDTLRNHFGGVLLNTIYSIIGMIILYFSIKFISDSTYATTTLSFILQILSILGALYIFYIIIHKTSIVQKLLKNRIFSFLYSTLFLIPKYVFEGSMFLYNNVKTSQSYVFKILIAQLIFITGWFLIPYIRDKLYNYNGIVLLVKPVHTNKETILGKDKIFGKYNENIERQNIDMSSSINKDLPYKYSLSCWIFINNQGGNMSKTSELLTPLLRYGEKTAILYNSSTNTFQITSKKGVDGSEVIYSTTKLPLQKWNNIIINYNSGNVDIFLNGDLVATKSGALPYVNHDVITAGIENGVLGGIKNIVYYPEVLDKVKIDWIYNSHK